MVGVDGKSFKNVLLGKVGSHCEAIFVAHKGDKAASACPLRAARASKWKHVLNLLPELHSTTHMGIKVFCKGHVRVGQKSQRGLRSWGTRAQAAQVSQGAAQLPRRCRT